MKTIGYDKPLYVLPFDHRGSFETKMFGWTGDLTAAQTAEISWSKRLESLYARTSAPRTGSATRTDATNSPGCSAFC